MLRETSFKERGRYGVKFWLILVGGTSVNVALEKERVVLDFGGRLEVKEVGGSFTSERLGWISFKHFFLMNLISLLKLLIFLARLLYFAMSDKVTGHWAGQQEGPHNRVPRGVKIS